MVRLVHLEAAGDDEAPRALRVLGLDGQEDLVVQEGDGLGDVLLVGVGGLVGFANSGDGQ
jgi:hypothetical protein